MYADNLVIFPPSSAGFQQLLNICSDYGIWYDVQYNTKKSVAMMKIEIWISLICIYQGKFEMYTAKYLGNIIYNEMSDDDYMYRQRRK